jgi:hypothetical protein
MIVVCRFPLREALPSEFSEDRSRMGQVSLVW